MIYIFFVVGFLFLIKGADVLISGASSIARCFRVSSLMIGLTVVAMGTSMPELAVNSISAIKGSVGLAIGNVIGSNIANILLILGITAIIYPLRVKSNTVWKEIPFSLLAVLILWIMSSDIVFDGISSVLSRIDGIVFLGFFIIFLYYTFGIEKEEDEEKVEKNSQTIFKSVFYIILGIGLLVLGGQWIVEGAIKIAEFFGLSERVIGITIVAVGTSLPELATSVVAAYKRQTSLAIGNVVGSNIFNIFFILGLTVLIKPIPILEENIFDIGILCVATILLFTGLFVGKRHTIGRTEGVFFILLYIAYLIYLVI